MALRISTNMDSLNIQNNLNKANSNVSKSLQRLSSGYRINSAKDDAAGFAVANAFKAKTSSLQVAQRNASEANTMLQMADGAYTKVGDILTRMKDLATQAASGQTENREKLQLEFGALQSEIDRIAYSTTYSTKAHDVTAAMSLALVANDSLSSTGITFQIGSTNTSSATSAAGGMTFSSTTAMQDSNVLNLKLNAACTGALKVGDSAAAGSISLSSLESAQAAMTAIDIALGSVNSYQASVGAMQNRLDFTMDNLTTQITNFQASESTIRDVDMAAEVTQFTKNQILQQAGMAMLSQANQAPQQVLQLLGG